MKKPDTSKITFLVEDAPEGGFTARALGTSIFTQADDQESLKEMVRDAVRCHFDVRQMPDIILKWPCSSKA
jgi:hypothetical protein